MEDQKWPFRREGVLCLLTLQVLVDLAMLVLSSFLSKFRLSSCESTLIVLYLFTGNIKHVHLNPLPQNATSATTPTKTTVAPGSTVVFDRSTQKLRKCNSTLCPHAKLGESETLINRAPTYGTGGSETQFTKFSHSHNWKSFYYSWQAGTLIEHSHSPLSTQLCPRSLS
jgi:hypothetical protein